MEAIKHRWSPRSFSGRPISAEDMETVIEAATWAFSGSNEQPWRYLYAHRGTALFDQLLDLLMPGNQPWCKNAAVLVLAMVQTVNAAGKPIPSALHDLGAANFALHLQANALGFYGHVMGGYHADRAATELSLPGDVSPVVMMALGYLDVPERLDEPFLTRERTPRTRKPVEEIVLRRE
jgi:nitroreductase